MILFIVVYAFNSGFSQQLSTIEVFLPMKDIDQTFEKLTIMPSNMGFLVHLEINASLKNYDDCSRKDRLQGGLKIEIDWYDANNETGKMMAGMIKSDIEKITQSFKGSSGFENMSEAVESNIKGGKMWIYTKAKSCVNEITGPTGETEHLTQIRAFVFTGSKMLKIDLKSRTKPSNLEQSLKIILEKWETFDFSTLN